MSLIGVHKSFIISKFLVIKIIKIFSFKKSAQFFAYLEDIKE